MVRPVTCQQIPRVQEASRHVRHELGELVLAIYVHSVILLRQLSLH